MPTESFDHAADELRKGARAAGDHGQAAVAEALGAAERLITEAASRAERILKDSLSHLRSRTDAYGDRARSYTDKASDQWDDAQTYVLERVRDRPLTAALAGLGAGVLIGLLLANRPK
jgi:ElaB/YqjD/DUF883 family membrane-anchored ribosome-binding protein